MNPASDYTILIVDDQVANLDVLSNLLRSHGFKVLAARDGEAALEIAQHARPDLILLDVILPKMDGFEVCRRLKADKLTEHIPVMFTTILEKIEDKIQGFQVGAADYITKPFQAEEVLARVTTQLRLRSLTRELQEANETLERRVAERTAQLAQVNEELQAEVVERRSAEEALSRANEALTRVNSAYRALSECNRIVVHATEEAELLQEICQTIVEYGDYLRACIDLVEPDEARTIRPVVQARCEGNQREKTPMTGSDLELRQVLSDSAIHTGKPVIYKDILSDPDLVSMRAEALRDGYASAAVFPLLTAEQETIGALAVYAAQVDAFDEEEIRLFMELATDMAFGVTSLRTRAERKRMEQDLITREIEYRTLVEHIPDFVVRYNTDLRRIYVNPAWERASGLSAKEVVNVPSAEVSRTPTPIVAEYIEKLQEALKTGVSQSIEFNWVNAHGVTLYLEYVVVPEYDHRDQIAGVLAVGRDITERKRVEAELRKLSRAVEQSPASVIITDTAGSIEYVNPKFTQLTGYALDEVVGQNPRFLKSGHMPPEEYKQLWETIASGGEWQGEFLNKKKNGEFYWEIASISPVRDAKGTIAHFIAVKEDITERKRAEEALAAERTLLRTVIDNLPDYIYAKDTKGQYVLKNLADVRQMGAASPDEVIGKTDFDYYPPELAEKYHADDQAVLQSGDPLINGEELSTAADGTQSWILTSKVPLRDSQGNVFGLVGIGRDITERKQAEEALQHYTQRLEILREIDQRIAIAHLPDAIANAVLERLVLLIPCEWASVVLYNREMSEEKVIAYQHAPDITVSIEDSQPIVKNRVLERLMSGESVVTDDLETQEGPIAKLTEDLLAQGTHSAMTNPLITQGRLIGALALASKQIGFFTSEHQQIAEGLGTQMAIALHQAELHDRIARHNAELEQRVRERTIQLEAANEELRILSRVKDEFVSNVSHELRTPITNLKLRHHLLAARPDRWEGHLAVMSRETQRLEQIIESLLYLSRLDQDRVDWNPTRVDLNHLASQFVHDRMALAQSGELSLSFTGEPDLPLAKVDVGLWEQALSILLTNAFNYTSAGGHVEVRTQVREQEGQRWVGVSVSDTGPGISPDEQSHLFERFFRGTAGRESGAPGTGLGLSIVQEIVNKHRGRVEVFSEGMLGKGATFSLWLLAAGENDEKQRVLEV